MQLRHLKYFIAVAEEGNVLHAAKRLHVAQPSVSRQIQDLEREVGCLLFERWARGVRLTEAGEAFLVEARNTLDAAARAIASARQAQERGTHRFTFAFGRRTHYPPVVTQLLMQFRAAHPDCTLRMRSMSDQQQRDGVASGMISAAVAWMCNTPGAEFGWCALQDSPIAGVLLPAAHPLATRDSISLEQLTPLTRLHHMPKYAQQLSADLRRALSERGLQPKRQRAIPADVTSVGLHIAAGDAYMLATQQASTGYTTANEAVVYRPFNDEPIPLSLAVFWRAADQAPCLHGFIREAIALSQRGSVSPPVVPAGP